MITMIKQIRNDLKPLPKFYGDVLEWPAFIEEYERTSASHTLSDFEKHERLNKALKGDARDLVSEKLKSTIFLNQVVAELRKKYGGKANIIKAAISKVDKIQRLGSNLKHIKKFVDDAITVQWMIQHYKEDGLETTLLIKMLDLIPSTIRLRWGDYQREIMKDGTGTFEDFVTLLKRIESEALIEDDDVGDRSNERRSREERRYLPYEDNRKRYNRRNERDYDRTPPRILHTQSSNRRDSRREDYYGGRRDHQNQYDYNHRRGNENQMTSHGYKKFKRDDPPVERLMTIQNGEEQKSTESLCNLGCQNVHSLTTCPKFKEMPYPKRNAILRDRGRCYNCSGPHLAKACPTKNQKQ